jgi:hypothetical protein
MLVVYLVILLALFVIGGATDQRPSDFGWSD